jgi:hypothetical protein
MSLYSYSGLSCEKTIKVSFVVLVCGFALASVVFVVLAIGACTYYQLRRHNSQHNQRLLGLRDNTFAYDYSTMVMMD